MKLEADVWIDVVCRGEGRNEAVCTLFARRDFASRPLVDESLNFRQQEGSAVAFMAMTASGPQRSYGVAVRVDDVSTYDVQDLGGIENILSIRCSPIYVVAEGDARIVCGFMTEQIGFEIDPYAINKLDERGE